MHSLGSLYVLDPSILQNSRPVGTASLPIPLSPAAEERVTPLPTASADATVSNWREAGATCIACGIGINSAGFETPADQRAHFRTDWHRLNVKRRLSKQAPLSEEQFEKLLEDEAEVSSISGSESSSSDEDDSSEATTSISGTVVGKQTLPLVRFETDDGRVLAVWRTLLLPDNAREQPPAAAMLRQLCGMRAGTPVWVVVMLRGGHFAAVVVRLRPPAGAKANREADPFEVLAHKTLHRYVVRAKAGGKQSAKDATGKFARSAGARLRRYNEVALEREISELLGSWQAHLAAATHIFVAAPSSNSRSIISADKPNALSPQDPRVRKLPFVTRRPTFGEAKRALMQVSSVYELEAVAAPAAAHEAKPVTTADQETTRQTEPATAAHQDTATPASGEPTISAQDAADEQPSTSGGPAAAQRQNDGGPLHHAAKAGDAELVQKLLEDGESPCSRDGRGRTPYAVAASKDVRDAFRRFAAQQPDRWDYAAAGLPSALTQEMEDAQKAKQAEKKAKQKAKLAKSKEGAEERAAKAAADDMAAFEAELAAVAAAAAATSSHTAFAAQQARAAAGRGGRGAARGKSRPPAPPPPTAQELAARRDMMAAAAEARMKALQAATEQQRLWSVMKKRAAEGGGEGGAGGSPLPRLAKLLLLPGLFAAVSAVQALRRRRQRPSCVD